MGNIYTCIEEKPLDIHTLVHKVQTESHGAIDLFIGTVRNHHEGKKVISITYDAHPNIVEKTFREICEEANKIWPDTNYAVSHYKGTLPVGGISIIIAVSSPHRSESFESCRFVIEEIKKRAPIWKQEHYSDGNSDWLSGHSLVHKTTNNYTSCTKCDKENSHG